MRPARRRFGRTRRSRGRIAGGLRPLRGAGVSARGRFTGLHRLSGKARQTRAERLKGRQGYSAAHLRHGKRTSRGPGARGPCARRKRVSFGATGNAGGAGAGIGSARPRAKSGARVRSPGQGLPERAWRVRTGPCSSRCAGLYPSARELSATAMLPFKLIYHERYDLNLGPHVFPSQKFRLIAEQLLREGIAETEDFLRPEPAKDEDILRVHTQDWVRKLKTGTLTASDVMKLEVPYSPELVQAVWLAAGGTILAAQSALKDGFGCNLSGGFHHAYPGHGEGFCAIHDVAVAIRRMQADGAIRKAIVVDTDVHHGNGTAAIFRGDPSVFTLSIHQENNYPAHKPPSTMDLHLADRVADEEYLENCCPRSQRRSPSLPRRCSSM